MTITANTIPTSLITEADRIAAIRLALGAALAHEHTAKLSNRQLAAMIGCGETTVRRYRKIADDIGLVGSIKIDAAPAPHNVAKPLAFRAWANLFGVFEATCGVDTRWARKMHARSGAFLSLLGADPSKEEIRAIYLESELMADEYEEDLPY